MDMEQIVSIDVINGTINAVPNQIDLGDKALGVTFKMHSHFDDVATREQGRPIFVMKEYILITIPGDLTGTVFRPSFEGDQRRFPEQYLRFKAGREQAVGTPLTSVSWLSGAQCDEMAFFRIQTVEQLANLSDANAQRFMGLNQMRERARQYLAQVKEDAPLNRLNAELATRDEQISTLTNQLASMQAMIAELQNHQQGVARGEGAETQTPATSPRRRLSRAEERAEVG
jgi:hypothetical protein